MFFDESSGSTDLQQILLIRTVMRVIGLIPVFMGTDAEACEIRSKTDCSRNTTTPELHAFIIHKLPPMNEKKFKDLQEKLGNLISATSLDQRIKQKKLYILGKLFTVSKKERPLFIKWVAKYIGTVFCRTESTNIDLVKLCSDLKKMFLQDKQINEDKKRIDFLKSQIILLMQTQWSSNIVPGKGKYEKFSPVAINRHIASLFPPVDYVDIVKEIPKSRNPLVTLLSIPWIKSR